MFQEFLNWLLRTQESDPTKSFDISFYTKLIEQNTWLIGSHGTMRVVFEFRTIVGRMAENAGPRPLLCTVEIPSSDFCANHGKYDAISGHFILLRSEN